MRSLYITQAPHSIPAETSARYRPNELRNSGLVSHHIMTGTFIHPLTSFVDKTFVIAEFELRKLRHDFTELITRALQPALWLLIFGQVFARSGMMHTGNIPYLDFIAPGILAQSVLFVAIFYGINVIWERDLGIVHNVMDGDDMLMFDGGSAAGFAQKAGAGGLVGGVFRLHHLDGDLAVQVRVVGAEHDSHAAFAEHLQNAKVVEPT